MNAEDWIEQLDLEPHPEGGFFKEVYRSQTSLETPGGTRSVCTHIYYLLRAGEFSQWHRIQSDEHWHFYAGSPLELRMVHPDGSSDYQVLGMRPDCDELLHTVVPGGTWFGSRPIAGARYALLGCTVAPGFDFQDFELTDPAALSAAHPALEDFIHGLLPS